MPEFIDRLNVLGIGEIGLNKNSRNVLEVLAGPGHRHGGKLRRGEVVDEQHLRLGRHHSALDSPHRH